MILRPDKLEKKSWEGLKPGADFREDRKASSDSFVFFHGQLIRFKILESEWASQGGKMQKCLA